MHCRLITRRFNTVNTLCLKINRSSETFYYNFAKIALMSIKIATFNLVRFSGLTQFVEKINVLVGARCSWSTATGFTLHQTSVSQLL